MFINSNNINVNNHRAMTSHTSFLEIQTKQYQDYAAKSSELKITLEHQQSIQSRKCIPKQYLPKQLKTLDSALTEEFNQQYTTLFFRQLEKVITNNSIKLKLMACTMTSIIVQTERYLSTLALPTQEVAMLHKKLLSEIQVKHHVAIPELQAKLQQNGHSSADPPITLAKRRRPKRKNTTPTSPPRKFAKQDSFLSLGPSKTQIQS